MVGWVGRFIVDITTFLIVFLESFEDELGELLGVILNHLIQTLERARLSLLLAFRSVGLNMNGDI